MRLIPALGRSEAEAQGPSLTTPHKPGLGRKHVVLALGELVAEVQSHP